MKRSDPSLDEIVLALQARHGIDPSGSAALRARLELALSEVPSGQRHLDAAFLDALADRMRVGETRFYRDRAQLHALATDVVPRFLDQGRCRVLSAGCSTGEEAYTLAMILSDVCGDRAIAWDVVGIDAGRASIEVARRARYPRVSAAKLPEPLRKWLREDGSDSAIDPALVARCRFERGDLLTARLGGPFQIILCRNVLIYLAPEAAMRAVDRLTEVLARGGVLVVARAEVQIVRRSALAAIEVGRPPVVCFAKAGTTPPLIARPPASRPPISRPTSSRGPFSRPPVSSEPPSRVRLVIDQTTSAQSIAKRGQALLSSGSPVIEIHIEAGAGSSSDVATALRRLIAAANAVQARCVAANQATARALEAMHVEL